MNNSTDELFERFQKIVDLKKSEKERTIFLEKSDYQYDLFKSLFETIQDRVVELNNSGTEIKVKYLERKFDSETVSYWELHFNIDPPSDMICITCLGYSTEITIGTNISLSNNYSIEIDEDGYQEVYDAYGNCVDEPDYDYSYFIEVGEQFPYYKQGYRSEGSEAEKFHLNVDLYLQPLWNEETNESLTEIIFIDLIDRIENDL